MDLMKKLALLPVPRMTRFTAVVAIAMAAGHLVQTLAAEKPLIATVARAGALPTHIVQLSSGGPTEPMTLPVNPEPHLRSIEQPNPVPACPVDLVLKGRAAGMIEVTLTAPCRGSERVVLRQADLAITARLGADGKATVTLPALAEDGRVAVLFGDGLHLEQTVAMPEAASLRRIGVQWQGGDAFALHAFQNGADFDQAGDISYDNRGDATLASGGFLTVLGDSGVENPLMAEIYTYPRVTVQDPQIVLEAAVLPETCGHDLLGEVLTSRSGRVEATDLTLAMPDCSGVGDFLVLKNLASDMKIAAN